MARQRQARYATDEPFPPITAVHCDQNEAFTLLYESSATGTWKALGFVTNRVTRRHERVTDFATLADGAVLDYGFFGEDGHEQEVADAGEDRLRVGTAHKRRVHELAVSVTPSDEDVLLGLESPSDAVVVGLEDDRTRGIDGDSLAEYGGVATAETATGDGIPTTALSPHPAQGIVRIDSEKNGTNPTRIAVNNQSGGQITLSADVFGAAYEVSLIRDSATVKNFLYSDTVRTLTWGGQGNTSPNLPETWGTEGVVTVEEDEATNLV